MDSFTTGLLKPIPVNGSSGSMAAMVEVEAPSCSPLLLFSFINDGGGNETLRSSILSGSNIRAGVRSRNVRFVSGSSGVSVQEYQERGLGVLGGRRETMPIHVRWLEREGRISGVVTFHEGTVSGSLGYGSSGFADLALKGLVSGASWIRLAGRMYASVWQTLFSRSPSSGGVGFIPLK